MKKRIPTIARVLMGLVFFASGVGGFVTHFAFPPDLPPDLLAFVHGIAASHYFFPLLKGTEIVCGLMLISGAFVPLALVVLAPILINIFCTHLFLAPSGLPLALVLGALEIYLAFFSKPYSDVVKQIFRCPMREAMLAKK